MPRALILCFTASLTITSIFRASTYSSLAKNFLKYYDPERTARHQVCELAYSVKWTLLLVGVRNTQRSCNNSFLPLHWRLSGNLPATITWREWKDTIIAANTTGFYGFEYQNSQSISPANYIYVAEKYYQLFNSIKGSLYFSISMQESQRARQRFMHPISQNTTCILFLTHKWRN